MNHMKEVAKLMGVELYEEFRVEGYSGDIKYKLTIRTTTNLPLQYVLYKNQTPTSANPTNILPSAGTVQAEAHPYHRR